MATITKGILGGFSGKVGTIVGANYRGKDIIRSRPKPSSKAPTMKQLLQQDKFKLVIQFLQPLKGIQKLYFGASSGSKSKTNLAASYMLNNALVIVANQPELVYNKVLITKGDLAGFQNLIGKPQQGSIIEFTWEDNSTQGNANESDVFSVVCYNVDLEKFEIFQTAVTRKDMIAQVVLPTFYEGLDEHVWVYFNNVEEKAACNSPYLGELTII